MKAEMQTVINDNTDVTVF